MFDIKTRGGYDTANQRYRQKSGAGAGADRAFAGGSRASGGYRKIHAIATGVRQRQPESETLWSLCVALDIPFARLLEPQVNKTQVIRRGEGTKVVAEQANYQAILLAACPPGARRDIYLLLTQPGADRISHPHPPGSVEHIIVTQGRARVGLTSAPEELGEGDYICYPADQEHVFQALEPDTQALLIAEQN